LESLFCAVRGKIGFVFRRGTLEMDELGTRHRIIDSNCYLGAWPTRRLRVNTAADLAKLARGNGVDRCLVSAFDAIFHEDYLAANKRLIDELQKFKGKLLAVPVENPQSPLCGKAGPGAARIVPCYHGYSPLSRRCQRFLRECESQGTTVFLSLRMRDERLNQPLLRLRPTAVKDLISSLAGVPGLNVVVNNARAGEVDELLSKGMERVRAGCEWSFPIGFIERMVDAYGDRRLVYGSNVPLHYYQSSLLQVLMAGISERSKRRILGRNLMEILQGL